MVAERQDVARDSPPPTGCLQVRVVDDHDRVALPGALVTLGPADGRSLRGLSNGVGEVTFDSLRLDQTYTVRVEFPGYAKAFLRGVSIGQGTTHLDVSLMERQAECIEIVDHPPLIDLEKNSVSTVFTAEFLRELPGGTGHSSYSGYCTPHR